MVRPHLANRQPKRAPEIRADAAPGPRSATLGLLERPDPPWLDAPGELRDAALAGCALPEAGLCGRFAARERALAGDRDGAGLACLAGDPARGQGYQECLFQAAEALAEARGAAGAGAALELCAWSSFGPMCVAHVLTLLGPPVPGADRVRAEDVAAAEEVARALREAAAGQPRLQASYVDRYWSAWTATTCRWTAHPDGRLWTLLPSEARHHLPVALAARLLRGRDPRALDFEALVAELGRVLADPGRDPDPSLQPRPERLTTALVRQAWAEDRGAESEVPSAWLFGPGRRALAPEDASIAQRLAVLEAAGQLGQAPPVAFFLDRVGDPGEHRLVRWTAARIAAALDPEAARAAGDPDPLVQRALVRAGGRTGAQSSLPAFQ